MYPSRISSAFSGYGSDAALDVPRRPAATTRRESIDFMMNGYCGRGLLLRSVSGSDRVDRNVVRYRACVLSVRSGEREVVDDVLPRVPVDASIIPSWSRSRSESAKGELTAVNVSWTIGVLIYGSGCFESSHKLKLDGSTP